MTILRTITKAGLSHVSRIASKSGIIIAVLFAVAACSGGDEDKVAKYNAYVTSANTYLSQGQFQSAMIEASNAIQLAGDQQEAYRLMAEIYLELGQPREAGKMLAEIKAPEEQTLLLLTEANLDSAKTRSAAETLKQLKDPSSASAMVLAARLASAEGDYQGAVERIEQVLAKDPEFAKAILGLARIQLGAGKFDEAKALLERSVQITESRAESLFLLSSVASRDNDMETAENYLNEAISSLPSTDIITPLRYAILAGMKDNLTAQGKTEEAMIYSGLLAEALPGAQQTTDLLRSAVESIQAGDLSSARSTLSEAREIAPASPRAATLLATVDFLEGNNEAAALQLEQIIDPETSSDTELQIYAVSQLRLGNADKVVERLSKDVDGLDNAKLMALYALALNDSGDVEKAKVYFRKAIELNPQDGRLHLPLAEVQISEGNDQQALLELQSAMEKSPSDSVVQRMLIGQNLKLGMEEQADKLVLGLESSYPRSLETQLLVAAYHLRQEDLDSAEAKFKEVLNLGESVFARDRLARIYMVSKRYPLAEEQYRNIIQIMPDNAEAYKGFITALELGQKKDGVSDELKKMFEQSKSNTLILVWSEYLGRNGLLQQARDVFNKYQGDYTPDAVRLSESLVLAVSRDYIAKDQISDARALLKQSVADFPGSERLVSALVTLDIKDQKFDSATAGIEQLRSFSDLPIVDLLTGDLSSAKGDFDAAKNAYLSVWDKVKGDQVGFKVYRALELANSDSGEIVSFLDRWVDESENVNVPLLVRAGYWLGAEEQEKAQVDYKQVIEAEPENAMAYNNLAWAYGEENPSQALAAGQRAYELAGDNPQIMDTYGWFLFKNGKRSEAIVILQSALELAPNDAEIRSHLEAASAEP